MWKIIKWPLFYVILQFILILLLDIIYIMGGNDVNFFSEFLAKNQIYLTLILGLVTIPIFYKNYKKLDIKENKMKDYLFLIFGGIILSLIYNIFAFYTNEYLHISNLYNNNSNIIKTLIATGLIGPIIEELMFRGLVYNNLKEKYSNMKSILITTIMFSLLHVDIFQLLYALALGFILIYVYEKYQNIKAPIIIHMASNITTTLFVPLLIKNGFVINYSIFIISLILLIMIYFKEVKK